MKKRVVITLFLFLGLFISTSSAIEVTLFGPNQYLVTKCHLTVYTDTFSATPGEGKLIIKNGDENGEHTVNSAVILVNGEEVFSWWGSECRHKHNQQFYVIEVPINLAEDNSITVKFSGRRGSYVTIEVTQEVEPPTVTISADPDIILVGESATLSWGSTNADTCVIAPDIGPVDPSGSIAVSPTETTTYIITATGIGGTATARVTVNVSDPSAAPVVRISATPATIEQGGASTLSWTSTSNAQTAYIDNGVGVVPITGSTVVLPDHTTIYTITVTGPTGSASAQAVVTVTGNPEAQPVGSFGEQYEDLIPPDSTVESYEPKRFSLITGLVQDLEGTPIAGVSITIHGHPEYGTAKTDADGRFSMPVEGGGTITLVYQKDGLLTVQRKVYVPWNDSAIAETIVMIAEDPASTTLTFNDDPEMVVTHQSTEVTDEFGSRSCSIVFAGDNKAYLVDEDGNDIQELTTITTRATEFTAPESMPAILPPNVAYTYCAELSVDGVQRVRFDKPVITWVDNFLGFDVGETVPVGYYDRDRGVWVPSDNGMVVKLLDIDTDGIVDALDADGDDQPDDLNVDGSYSDEVTGLSDAGRYPPGSSFWRVAVDHFTPWDWNWPWGPPPDAEPPNPEGEPEADQQKNEEKDCQTPTSSFVEERSRIFHEDIPIPGTDMALHYASNRVEGYKTVITVPASGETVPDSLKRIIVQVDVAGRTFEQILGPLPNQKAEFIWDGLDHLGRPVRASITANVRVGFVYDALYYSAREDFEQSFALAGTDVTGIMTRQEVTSWRRSNLAVFTNRAVVGMMEDEGLGSGWTLSVHHRYDPISGTVFLGNGDRISGRERIIETVAGTGFAGYSGDGGPAVDAQLYWARGLAVAPDGSLYIADRGNHRIRKVSPDGIITTVAGTGTSGYSGDGGPAVDAQLYWPLDVAVAPDGSLYIADASNQRIRKVSLDGTITTVAGTGTSGYSGDGGPAVDAQLYSPFGVAVAPDGSLYIADTNNYRVRKVSPDGTITTVAGNGTFGYSGDGGPAVDARIYLPVSVAVAPDGSLYIVDHYNNRVRKVSPDGIITTVAGNGTQGYSGDGGPAVDAQLYWARGLAVAPDGSLYIADSMNHRIRKVSPDGTITTVAGNGTFGYSGDGGPAVDAQLSWPTRVAVAPDGSLYSADESKSRIRRIYPSKYGISLGPQELLAPHDNETGYVFSETDWGHIRTIDLATGVALLTFHYDGDGRLVSITDRFGNQVAIQRNASGVPTSITSPDGLTTTLTVDANNNLTRITHPDGSFYSFEYTLDGLATAKIEPEGNRFEHIFDPSGRLTDFTDQEGGHWQFSRTAYENGDILSETLTGEGNLTSYLDHKYSTGAYTSTITDPTGAETLFAQSADGLTVNKSLPCGMELAFRYDFDSEYKCKYVKEMTESTPSGLEKITLRAKTYQDTDLDDIFDLITEIVTVNGNTTTLENNTLQSQKTITSPEWRTVTTLYDPNNLLTTSLTIPGLYETTYGYDLRGRLTSISTNTRETSFAYDPQGFLASITDPEGYTTSYDYDAVGRMTGICRPDGGSVGFTYDKNGNMTVLTNPSVIDHGFGYNGVNLNSSYQTPLSGSYSYVYDKDRHLAQINFPSGNQINNVYDKTRLVQIQTPEGDIDLSYLCGTKVGSIAKGTESVTYGYDGRLVTSETLIGTLNQSLGYAYNNDFNLAGFTYAGKSHVYTYDNDGLLTGAGDFAITRNAGNGLPEAVTGAALNLSHNFSGYGELVGQDFVVNGSSLTSWNLTRDNAGKITAKTETVDSTTSNYAYTYDPMGRLLTVTKDGILVEEYEYGPNGTRTYEMNALRGIAGRAFTYSDEDHLLTAGTAAYQYDLDGFLVSKTEDSDLTLYDYSSRGGLLSVTLPDGGVIEYVHDPLGRRIAKKVDGVIVEKYLWQGLTRLLAVYDGSDNLLMRFEYADGRMPVAMTRGGATYYLTYDQVGSLRVVADASGSVVKRIDYDSFGNIIGDTDPAFTVPFGFAGGLHDRDTGLVRFGYRDYDPDIGRWTAKDPIGFAGGDTDLYGYCLNDPVNWIDPDGTILQYVGGFFAGYAVGHFLSDVYDWSPVFTEIDKQEAYIRLLLNNCPSIEEQAILQPALERIVRQKTAVALKIGVGFMETVYSLVSPSPRIAHAETEG